MWEGVTGLVYQAPLVKRIAIHSVIVLGFLLAVWGVSGHFETRAEKFAEGWRKQLDPITCTNDPSVVNLSSTPNPAALRIVQTTTAPPASGTGPATATAVSVPIPAENEKAYEIRLAGQFHTIQQRIHHHFEQMITYYSYAFTTTIMVGVLAAIAAITLVFITFKGWQPSSEYLKTIFLVATVTATYSAAFPGIFQLQKNVDDNRFLYLKYVGLANEMCSYQVTTETVDKLSLDQATFIHRVDTEMSNLNKIAVGLDISQIPEFSKAINQAVTQTPPGSNVAPPKAVPPAVKPSRPKRTAQVLTP
jgi:hypothetical protein